MSVSHVGNPHVTPPCAPQEKLGMDCESKDKRNPCALEMLPAAIKRLTTLVRDSQPAGTEILSTVQAPPNS